MDLWVGTAVLQVPLNTPPDSSAQNTSAPTNRFSGVAFFAWPPLFRPPGSVWRPLFRRRQAAPRGKILPVQQAGKWTIWLKPQLCERAVV